MCIARYVLLEYHFNVSQSLSPFQSNFLNVFHGSMLPDFPSGAIHQPTLTVDTDGRQYPRHVGHQNDCWLEAALADSVGRQRWLVCCGL